MTTLFHIDTPRRLLRAIAVGTALAVLLGGGYWYWRYSSHFISTDNAYVNAHVVQMAAQVSGQVKAVHVSENQTVVQGEELLEIDPQPFQLAVEKTQAQMRQRTAELQNAERNAQRIRSLVQQHFVSSHTADDASTSVATAKAALNAAAATLQEAKLNLEHTHVRAPVSGTIANLSLQPGSVVQADAPLFAIIGTDQYWIDANFKETELGNIHKGDAAEIHVDSYPDHVFQGTVTSLSGGSGTAFSLLPPQNATGNWVKVTQRVPVKIVVLDPDADFPLRIGTSAEVTVRFKSSSQLAAKTSSRIAELQH